MRELIHPTDAAGKTVDSVKVSGGYTSVHFDDNTSLVFDVEHDNYGDETYISSVSSLPDIHQQKDAGLLTDEEYGDACAAYVAKSREEQEGRNKELYRRLYERFGGQPPVPVEEEPKPFRYEGGQE